MSVLEDGGEEVGNPRASGSVKTQEPQEVPESGNKVRNENKVRNGETKFIRIDKVQIRRDEIQTEKTRSPKMENMVWINRVRSVRREKTRNRAHSSGVPLECG